MNLKQRAMFIVELSHHLTVRYREIFKRNDLPPELRSKILYGLNEVQHQLTAQLKHYASASGVGPPDEKFISVLTSTAKEFGIEDLLRIDIALCSRKI